MIAATLAIELFLMTCIGIFTAKMKIVPDSFSEQLTIFLMKVALPCLIIISVSSGEFSLEMLKNCFIALVMGAMSIVLSLLLGQIAYVVMGKGGAGRVMRFGLAFTHYSFMGIPVVDALFGATGNLYYVMFLVPVRILYYALPPKMFGTQKTEKKTLLENIKNVMNPCMCAVIIGIIVWVTGFEFPTVIYYCLNSLNKICSPLGLILCGLVLGRSDVKKLLNPVYFRLPLMRTIVMPLIFLGVTRIMVLMGVDEILCNMTLIYSALPCASMTAMFALQYETDQDVQFEAAGSVFIATILSTFTIPIWYSILHVLFT